MNICLSSVVDKQSSTDSACAEKQMQGFDLFNDLCFIMAQESVDFARESFAEAL